MYQSHLFAIKSVLFVFPFVALALLIPYIIYQYFKFGSLSFFRTLVLYAFIFYLISTVFIVMLPLRPRSVVANMTTPWTDMRLFGFVTDLKAKGLFDIHSIKDVFKLISNDRFMEPFLNICMLIPFGVFLRYYFKKSWFTTVVLSLCFSLTIEFTQLSGLFGFYSRPHRLFQIDDLVLNTLGGGLGYLLTPLIVFMFPTRDDLDERAQLKQHRVSLFRKVIALGVDLGLFLTASAIAAKLFYGTLNLHILKNNPLRYLALLIVRTKLFYFTLLYLVIYFVFLPYITKGFTIGDALVKLKIKNTDNSRLSFGRLLIKITLVILTINVYYWTLYWYVINGQLSFDLPILQTYLLIFVAVVSIFLIVDSLYSLYKGIPFVFDRVAGLITVSLHEEIAVYEVDVDSPEDY